MKLSVVLAVQNEEENIGSCLDSVKNVADEIIIADDGSIDKTVEIAQKKGAKVYKYIHKKNFHETKQFAIEKAKGDWILQLDADERLSTSLAEETEQVISLDNEKIHLYQKEQSEKYPKNYKLFLRHQNLIAEREGGLGKQTGEIVAFFVPRINYFLGGPLIHGGVYPDGVIRLFKNGKAKLPAKSVHELMEVDGEVGWLFNNLEHHESPTLKRYLDRANRYTDYTAKTFKEKKVAVNYWTLFKFCLPIPLFNFLKLYFRHKGFMDGMRGFVWSVFSSLHFPIAYFKYFQSVRS